jgi:hypothetical protein
MTDGKITTTHKSGESVQVWVGRHNTAVEAGTPSGNTLETSWPCDTGTEKVTTTRQAGETDGDFTLRHVAAYMLQMVGCPPVP